MVDQWGRPEFNDWMGMANMIGSLTGAAKDRTAQFKSQRANEYLGALNKDPNFDAKDAPEFDAEAWAAAQETYTNINNAKMDFDVKRRGATLTALLENSTQSIIQMTNAKDSTNNVTDPKKYNEGLGNLIKGGYNLIHNGYKVVDFNFHNKTMNVVNEVTGTITKEPIPSETAVRNVLSKYFEFKGDLPTMSKEGSRAFFHFMGQTEDRMKMMNQDAWKTAEVLTNGKGRRVEVAQQYDLRGGMGGGMHTVYREKSTGKEWTQEQWNADKTTADFKPYKEQKAIAGIAQVKQQTATSKANEDYTRSLKGVNKDERVLKMIRTANPNKSEAEILKMYNDEVARNKTIVTRLNAFNKKVEEEYLDMNDPEDQKKYAELVRKEQPDIQRLLGFDPDKEKIKVTGGQTPPKKYPDAKQAPDGNWYVKRNGKFFKVKQ